MPKERINEYSNLFEKHIVYINLPHFINFLNQTKFKNKGVKFQSIDNIQHLIPEWYYKDILPKEEYKINSKLFNKLRKIKLEDALLYEIALRYLYLDKAIIESTRKNVKEILTSEISFKIADANNIVDAKGKSLYELIVPFNKLETLAVLIQHKTEQEDNLKNNKTSFLTNLDTFLQRNENKLSAEIKKIVTEYKSKKTLRFEDLNKINNYIISTSITFSEIHMLLEKFYILKNRTIIKQENRIKTEEIDGFIFKEFYYKRFRKKALHFGVPEKPYIEILKEVEEKFLKREKEYLKVDSFDLLPKNIKDICSNFMNILHNNLYSKRGNSKQEERKVFEKKYFYEIIKKVL